MAYDQLFSSTTEGETSGEIEVVSFVCFAIG